MKKKHIDGLLLLISVVALGFSAFAYFRVRGPRSQVAIKEELTLIGVVREYDCVECIKKVLCFWNQLEKVMMDQGVKSELIFTVESTNFDEGELRYLCQLPGSFVRMPITEVENTDVMPMNTPSIMLRSRERVLILEPIFLGTNMEDVRQRFEVVITEFLPQAR